MEINALLIYLMYMVDTVKFISNGILIVLLSAWVVLSICVMTVLSVCMISGSTVNYKALESQKYWFKPYIIVISILLCVSILVPSSKTIASMILVPPIVNDQSVKELPTNVIKFVNDWLKENKPTTKE